MLDRRGVDISDTRARLTLGTDRVTTGGLECSFCDGDPHRSHTCDPPLPGQAVRMWAACTPHCSGVCCTTGTDTGVQTTPLHLADNLSPPKNIAPTPSATITLVIDSRSPTPANRPTPVVCLLHEGSRFRGRCSDRNNDCSYFCVRCPLLLACVWPVSTETGEKLRLCEACRAAGESDLWAARSFEPLKKKHLAHTQTKQTQQ